MESFPLFFRIRAVTFTIVMLFSFLWLALLSVEMFTRWTVSDRISHSLMILLMFTNTTTLILLPILILVKFRVWLDAVRLLLLIVLQAGSAAANTYWTPRIQCPDQTPDETGVCQLIGVYTMIACWIIPAILVVYSIYFAVVVYLQSRIPAVVEFKRCSVDPEIGSTSSPSQREIIQVQGSSTDTSLHSRQLLPTMVHTGQSSLPQPLPPQPQTTLLNPPRRQLTVPSLPHASQQLASGSVPSRHHSLPAFKHGNEPHPLLALPIPNPPTANVHPSHPQTPSLHSYTTPSLANPRSKSFSLGPGITDKQSSRDHRWHLKHLSTMSSSSSSPREIQNTEGSPTSRSTRARLSKPLPVHLM